MAKVNFFEDFHKSIFSDLVYFRCIPGGQLSESQSYGVYRTGYYARATEALGEIYETTWRYLGDEDFFALVEKYVKANPSMSPNLAEWNYAFMDFSKDLFHDDELLSDLLTIDETYHNKFHSSGEYLKTIVDPLDEAMAPLLGLVVCDGQILKVSYKALSVWCELFSKDISKFDLEENYSSLLLFRAPSSSDPHTMNFQSLTLGSEKLLRMQKHFFGDWRKVLENWEAVNDFGPELNENDLSSAVSELLRKKVFQIL